MALAEPDVSTGIHPLPGPALAKRLGDGIVRVFPEAKKVPHFVAHAKLHLSETRTTSQPDVLFAKISKAWFPFLASLCNHKKGGTPEKNKEGRPIFTSSAA